MRVTNINLNDFLSYFIHTINNDIKYKKLSKYKKFELVITGWEKQKFKPVEFNILFNGKPLSPGDGIKRYDVTFIVLNKYNEIDHHSRWYNKKYHHFYHNYKEKVDGINITGNIRISVKPI